MEFLFQKVLLNRATIWTASQVLSDPWDIQKGQEMGILRIEFSSNNFTMESSLYHPSNCCQKIQDISLKYQSIYNLPRVIKTTNCVGTVIEMLKRRFTPERSKEAFVIWTDNTTRAVKLDTQELRISQAQEVFHKNSVKNNKIERALCDGQEQGEKETTF